MSHIQSCWMICCNSLWNLWLTFKVISKIQMIKDEISLWNSDVISMISVSNLFGVWNHTTTCYKSLSIVFISAFPHMIHRIRATVWQNTNLSVQKLVQLFLHLLVTLLHAAVSVLQMFLSHSQCIQGALLLTLLLLFHFYHVVLQEVHLRKYFFFFLQ